ncbi:MAG: PIG-L deacetylase family protein [Candidatus Acidiferrales bacterium]
MKILVTAAHPDDELLGCGATVARLATEGHEIYFAILGEGLTSRHPDRQDAQASQLEALRRSSRKAACTIGAKDVFFYGLPDNRLDTIPLLEVTKIIEELIEKLQPQVIYTHHEGDLNIDHGVVSRAVLTAARPIASQSVREIYAFEVPSSTDWAFQRCGPAFRPNTFVDVEKTLEQKILALAAYETEMRQFPHPRSPEALRATAQRWGSVIGRPSAEAFELVRGMR